MHITDERHTIFYRNPAMRVRWFEVQVIWSNGDYALVPGMSYDGTLWSRFSDGDGDLDNVFDHLYVKCNPSVRKEVEKVFEEYLSFCGIGGCSVIKEAHIFYITVDETEYIVNFEGIPGHGRVRCSVEQDERSVNLGMLGIDIKRESELLKYVYGKFNSVN